MHRISLVASFCLVLAGACNRERNTVRTESANVPADNTKKNERDREGTTVTPLDQSESEADRRITQEIRQQVVKDDRLSLDAKNVKIITIDGVATLRGPVKNQQERADIGALATRIAGVKRVDNQLEVAPN
jgi:hyperosmotically inducible periplasmic protein